MENLQKWKNVKKNTTNKIKGKIFLHLIVSGNLSTIVNLSNLLWRDLMGEMEGADVLKIGITDIPGRIFLFNTFIVLLNKACIIGLLTPLSIEELGISWDNVPLTAYYK